MIVKTRNILDKSSQYSYLSEALSAGTGPLKVKNINPFTASYAVQIGNTGENQAETIMLGTATPAGTGILIVGTLRYDHPTDTPVYSIKYNQIIFKKSSAGTSGTAAAFTGSTANITPNSEYTQYDDTSGVVTDAYKTQYYNSVTTAVSAESDWITPSGFSFYSLAKLRDRIKKKLHSSGYIKYDETIDDWINEWLEKMTNTIIDVNRDYLIGTTDVAFSGTAELGTITATDYKEVRKIWWTADGTDWFQMTRMDLNDFEPTTTYSDSHPYYFFQGDNVIGRKPNEVSGTARVYYYQTNSVLDDDTDELPVSMRNYTKSFVDYGLGQAYLLDEKIPQGNLFISSAMGELNAFRNEMTPRHKSGPQMIDIVSPTGSENDLEVY